MALKIEMLRCFATVAQAGNLAEAANRLGRTQSAISMMLKQLEDHLGQRLFESDRKNRLTVLGQQVFDLSQSQLRQFDQTVKSIETSASSPNGLIRIASIPSVAGLVFPSAIAELTHQNPGLKIELRDTDTPQVIDALLRGQADIGVVSGQHQLNEVRQAHLFSDPFGLICAPDHPLAQLERATTIADIANANFIHNNLCGTIEMPEFQTAIAGSKIAMHNTMSLITMVGAGGWVTVLPKTVAPLMRNDLVFRQIVDLPEQRDVYLLMREKTPFLQFSEQLWLYITQFFSTKAVDPNAERF